MRLRPWRPIWPPEIDRADYETRETWLHVSEFDWPWPRKWMQLARYLHQEQLLGRPLQVGDLLQVGHKHQMVWDLERVVGWRLAPDQSLPLFAPNLGLLEVELKPCAAPSHIA